MATPRLFKLKSQIAPAPSGPTASNLPFAKVWVDTGVFHLDQPFDYQVPENLSELVQTGVRVQVPFGTREVEGLVIERSESAEVNTKIRSISKVLSAHPVATQSSLALIKQVAELWASNPWDIIRSAIPARVASVDKSHSAQRFTPTHKSVAGDLSYRAFQPHASPHKAVAQLAIESSINGSVLIVAPDERDIERLVQALSPVQERVLRIDSGVSRTDRYASFLRILSGTNHIIIGARNAIFAPLPPGSTIIVFKESAADLYELRAPGWNARDIAFLRKDLDSAKVIFCGYVPALEVAQLIEDKKVRYLNSAIRVNVKAFESDDSSLLPGRIFTDIRASVKTGPVLFVLPRKGYANSILCAHCKNVAMCKCGARLHLSSKNAHPSCRICGAVEQDWKCSFCQRDRKFIVSRGIERASEEISRAFPNIPVILSYADVMKESVENRPSFILSTPGSAPEVDGGYSAVVILEGLTYFSHDDLRANERASELFFETAAMVKLGGAVLLSISDSHPIVSSLIRWNPSALLKRELKQRAEICFPPFVSSAVLQIPTAQANALVMGINKAISEGRVASDVRLLGPTKIDAELSKIVVMTAIESHRSFVAFMHELMRRRSIAKKLDSTLRINPYSL